MKREERKKWPKTDYKETVSVELVEDAYEEG
jgi:hypothetical protein